MEVVFLSELAQLISNVGFPIVAYFMLCKSNSKLQDTLNNLSETLKGIDIRLEQLEGGKNSENNYRCRSLQK